MCSIQPTSAQRHRELDDGGEVVPVLAVDDGVESERQADGDDQAPDLQLPGVAVLEVADAVGVLEAELHMVEPGRDQALDRARSNSTPEVMKFV